MILRAPWPLPVGLLALLALGACSHSHERAQQQLTDIDVALLAAGPDGEKYLPDRVNDIETRLRGLRASLDRHDDAAVLKGAPALLADAQGLARAAATKKLEARRSREEQWATLSVALTRDLPRLQTRLEFLRRSAHRKQAAGIDLPGARADLGVCESLWSKAQGAFGNDNLEEAVSTAREVKQRAEALATRLRLEPSLAP
ncbi:MAG TPA: hypothetical protein VKT22_08965 [Steroidobacteraceae bacterium]|nr:hypothetical protein [Steroidobacteraceae bacterium]